MRRGEARRDIGAGAEAGIDEATRAQRFERGGIVSEMRRLAHRIAIPVQPEPGQALQDRLGRFRGRTFAVCVLDSKQEFPAAAARIKSDRTQVRDETRKAQVIANAQRNARDAGVPEPLVAALWETLVESSISYETVLFDQKSTTST